MKKILSIVTIVFFILSSYLFVDLYAKKEVSNLLEENNKYHVNIINQNQDNIIATLLSISKEYDIDIQKNVYRIQENGNYKIDIFTTLNTDENVVNKLLVKGNVQFYENTNSSSFLSNRKLKDTNQIGQFSLLNKEHMINVRQLKDANRENLSGIYYLIGVRNDDQFTRVKNALKSNGIQIDKSQVFSTGSDLNVNISSYIPIVLLLVVITVIYYYILSYKEISIMLLNGYSYKKIIAKKMKFIGVLNTTIISLIMLGYMFYHYTQNQIFNGSLYGAVFLFLLILCLALSALELLCSFWIKFIDVKLGLKNRKPQKQINILNMITKVVFCLIIVFTSTNTFMNLKSLRQENYNMSDWRESIDYAFTTLNSLVQTENSNSFEQGSKCQKLYTLLEEKGAILARVNAYYQGNKHQKEEENKLSKEYGTHRIDINNNYLEKYPVYDINGHRIQGLNINENKVTILVPEKYLSKREEIEKSYIDEFQLLRYFDENLYNELHDLAPIETLQEINFIYIKNNQEHFSFKPEMNKERNNYIKDSVLVLTNGYNRGSDVYQSIISNGDLLVKVSSPELAYSEILPYIVEADLKEKITSTPSVYSRVDQEQYALEQTLKDYLFMLIISSIGYIVITIFITFNYIESNKEINVIKKLFGYSFIKRNRKYYILSSIPLILINMLSLFFFKEIMFSFYLMMGMLVIEGLTISFTLILYDRLTLNDVLKGS